MKRNDYTRMQEGTEWYTEGMEENYFDFNQEYEAEEYEAVYCRTDKEVHHCVKHIIPVVCKEVEHHHYHHNYITKTEVVKEYDRRDHGRRPQHECKKAGCNDKFDC